MTTRTQHSPEPQIARAGNLFPAFRLVLAAGLFAMVSAVSADTAQSSDSAATLSPEQIEALNSQIDVVDLQIAARLKTMQDELDRIARILADEAHTLDEVRAEVRSFSADRAGEEG